MTRKQIRLLRALGVDFAVNTEALDKQIGHNLHAYDIQRIINNVNNQYTYPPEYVTKTQSGWGMNGGDVLLNTLGAAAFVMAGFGIFSLGGIETRTVTVKVTLESLINSIDKSCADLYKFFKMPAKNTEIGAIQKKYGPKFFKWFEKYNSSTYDDIDVLRKEWVKIHPVLNDLGKDISEIVWGDSRVYYMLTKQIGQSIKQSIVQKKLDKRLEKGKDKGFWTNRLRNKITKYDNRIAKYDDKIAKLREKLNQSFYY